MTINKMFTIEPSFNIMKTQPTFPLISGYHPADLPSHVLADPKIGDISIEARARYANIMYDTAFKLIFGSPANHRLLIELLECLIPGRKIRSVSFRDKEIPGFFVGDKKTVFDLFCTSADGETFVVEMQLHGQQYFTDRMLFYSTYPVREQVVTPAEEEKIRKLEMEVRQRNTYQLRPVYMVGILNFELPHDDGDCLRDGLVSAYSVRSDYGKAEAMTDALHFVFLELPRLQVDRNHPEDCRTMLERVAFSFRHISFLSERPASFTGEFFEHLFHAAELANMTSEERKQYDFDMVTEIDKRAHLEYARVQGHEEGLREGHREGQIAGQEKEKRRIAAEMKKLGLPDPIICQATSLSPEEVRAL